MRGRWILAPSLLTLAACGSHAQPPQTPSPDTRSAVVVGCAEGGTASRALTRDELKGSVVSGPLTLVHVRDNAAQPARSFQPARQVLRRIAADPRSTTRVRRMMRRALRYALPGSYWVAEGRLRVAAGEEATVAVAPEQRRSVSLVFSRRARNEERRGAPGAYRVADGDSAVRFRACPDGDTGFLGGFVVAGSRCVHLTVTTPGHEPDELRLPFGPRRCSPGRTAVKPTALLAGDPYLGVSCRHPGSIACDRVGLAVRLEAPAARVRAAIQGRPLRLHATRYDRHPLTLWEGFLQPAGLLHGPLKVIPDRGRYRWQGSHPRDARVRIDVLDLTGSERTTRLVVPLRPGWG